MATPPVPRRCLSRRRAPGEGTTGFRVIWKRLVYLGSTLAMRKADHEVRSARAGVQERGYTTRILGSRPGCFGHRRGQIMEVSARGSILTSDL